jgi:hypothetical protein
MPLISQAWIYCAVFGRLLRASEASVGIAAAATAAERAGGQDHGPFQPSQRTW